jgi:SAM-dependent methyltransferase
VGPRAGAIFGRVSGAEGRGPFADYLEAKFALDERSLNADVRRAVLDRLGRERRVLRWLDVGAGTGAMVRRLLAADPAGSVQITVLDRDPGLLGLAPAAIADALSRLEYTVRRRGSTIEAARRGREIHVDFRCSGLMEFDGADRSYDLVTAHAFMDIVPIDPAVSRIAAWLAPGGLFYATLNYDGHTTLFPLYADPAFEDAILAGYDRSMEERRVDGEATGGARSGRRLHRALHASQFHVFAYGSSDWNITPAADSYRDRDADVLRTLLAVIREESERSPLFDRGRVARWHAERTDQLARGELGMIVHHVDLGATRLQQRLVALT